MNFAAVPSLLGGEPRGARPDAAERFADFEGLYLAHRDLVRRVAYNLGGLEDLDDIVQETFVRLWKGLEGFRGEASPRTWVYRVTLNTARDHWRKRGRYKSAMARYTQEAPPPSQKGPEQERWELGQAVARGLAGLSAEHREAVTLCYLEGLSVAEAADAAGVPEGTIKSRLHHAREKLGQLLGERSKP
jgi:RNA polymerase sigma-70 factor (ECF subfamily)